MSLLALLVCVVAPLASANAQSQGEIAVEPALAPSIADGWQTYYANPANRPLSLRLEYLHWWMNENNLPHLVTTSPPGTLASDAGVLGRPGTETLFGNEGVDSDGRGGFRGTLNASLAHWFDNLANLEFELHLITLGHGQDTGRFVAESSGDPILARPFFDLDAVSESSVLTAFPGLAFPNVNFPLLELVSGRIEVGSSSDFDSAGALFRHTWRQTDLVTINFLAGYRFLRYQEMLTVSESQVYLDPGDPTQVGTVESFDSFDTWSEFHGGEVGVEVDLDHEWATLQMLAKVAIGNVHQILTIDGETRITTPDPAQDQAGIGGLLTAPSNIGRHSNNHLGVVPEFGITLHAALTRTFDLTAGYTLIVFPQVLRTGDQIDTSVNPSQPANARPRVRMNESTLWIHGIHAGVEF